MKRAYKFRAYPTRPQEDRAAQAIAPVVCVQNRYSIDSRQAGTDEILRTCDEQGIAFGTTSSRTPPVRFGSRRTK